MAGSCYELARMANETYQKRCGYIFGTSGQIWTSEAQKEICRKYTADPSKYADYANSVRYGDKWIDKTVYDCSGLIMDLCKRLGISLAHGSNSQYRACKIKGSLPKDDLLPGTLVFKLRNGDDYHHVGVYIGDNITIEAKGAQYGVVATRLDDGWTHYGLVPGLSYTDAETAPVEAHHDAKVETGNNKPLNIRKSTSTKSEKIDTIANGQTVHVLAVSGDWAKVRYEKEGYVMCRFLIPEV